MKLFASDFDGTLYNREKLLGIEKEVFDAIREFQKEGNLFGICTGRAKDISFFKKAFQGKLNCDFYILQTGAIILDKDYQELFVKHIDKKVALNIFDRYKKSAIINVIAREHSYELQNSKWMKFIRPFRNRKYLIDSHYKIDGFSIFTVSSNVAKKITDEINHDYGDWAAAYQNKMIVDVVAAGCSKATGIELVKELFKPDITFGIGDSYNDIPLLKGVDVGFTFKDAPIAVKDNAKYLVNTFKEAIKKTESL